ncbi:SMI1/KNR4 family protein [Virgisporangium aurantiacum]|uniref:SMI1/KNR4 family protein n=1 Tax=Virgisporangium aurantiacum TaxID=175570 RepID=UPI0019524368|nr:SMI1/KNR4 family protein [Virgisporangium aurantiacum]
MAIDDNLNQIDEWLRHHAPATFADLGPPAGPDHIAALENTVGLQLHPDVTALLRWHNGSGRHDRGFPLSPGFPINSTTQIAGTWQRLTTLATQIRDEEDMQGWWEPTWIPVASDYTGFELVVDHGPHITGQVFHFDPTEGRSRLRPSWPNLATIVPGIATALQSGSQFAGLVPVIDEDGYLDWE